MCLAVHSVISFPITRVKAASWKQQFHTRPPVHLSSLHTGCRAPVGGAEEAPDPQGGEGEAGGPGAEQGEPSSLPPSVLHAESRAQRLCAVVCLFSSKVQCSCNALHGHTCKYKTHIFSMQVQGKMLELARHHTASRILQFCVMYGTEAQKKLLMDHVSEFAPIRLEYLACKMLVFSAKGQTRRLASPCKLFPCSHSGVAQRRWPFHANLFMVLLSQSRRHELEPCYNSKAHCSSLTAAALPVAGPAVIRTQLADSKPVTLHRPASAYRIAHAVPLGPDIPRPVVALFSCTAWVLSVDPSTVATWAAEAPLTFFSPSTLRAFIGRGSYSCNQFHTLLVLPAVVAQN